jgi:hypothetical protein
MKPSLLIVSEREDFTADYLIVRLRERALPYYRLNSDELAVSAPAFRAGEGDTLRQVNCGEASVDLDSIGCVWYRRAVRPQAPSAIHTDFRAFACAELRHLYEGLISSPTLRWVNPANATELAERKIYQLRIAGLHGLKVPPTLVSSDREALQEFVDRHHNVICKAISHGLIRAQGQAFAVHTRAVTRSEMMETETLGGIPLLLQRRILKGVDIRVTIIGNAVFPVEVITPVDGPVDWRANREGLKYRLCDLPVNVEQACRSFMRELGLLYGACDFIRTDEGEWYFLEINPAGEWAWLDLALGLSMRDSLIDTLYGN